MRVGCRIVCAALPLAFLLACETGTGPDSGGHSKGTPRLDTTLYPNGKIGSIRTFRDTVRHGLSVFWYESGALASVSHHENGIRQGWGFGWHENGEKSSENFRQAGVLVCTTDWDEAGAVIEKIECAAGLYSDSTYGDWKTLAGVK